MSARERIKRMMERWAKRGKIDLIIAELKNPDRDIKLKAINLLEKMGDVKAEEPLILLLKNTMLELSQLSKTKIKKRDYWDNSEVFLQKKIEKEKLILEMIIQVLGKLRSGKSIDILLEILNSNDYEGYVYKCVIGAFGNIKDIRVAGPVFNIYISTTKNPINIDEECEKTLVNIGGKKVIDLLTKGLIICKYGKKRLGICRMLTKLGVSKWNKFTKGNNGDFGRLAKMNDKYINDLLVENVILESRNIDESSKITSFFKLQVLSLGESKDENVIQVLLSLMDKKNIELSMAAVKSIGKIGGTKSQNELIYIADCDIYCEEIRMEAIKLIAKKKNIKSLNCLIKLLDDDNTDVKCAVLELLYDYKHKIDIKHIAKLLNSDDVEVGKAAIQVLGKLNNTEATEALIEGLEIKNTVIVESILAMLGQLKCIQAFDAFIDLLSNKNSRIQVTAIEAIENIGSEKANEHLVNCLTDKDYNVKKAASKAIQNLGNDDDVDLIFCMLNRTKGRMKSAEALKFAVITLGNIVSEKAMDALVELLDSNDKVIRNETKAIIGDKESVVRVKEQIERITINAPDSTLIDVAKELLKIDTLYSQNSLAIIFKHSSANTCIELLDLYRGVNSDIIRMIPVEPLIEELNNCFYDTEKTILMIDALGKIGSKKATDYIVTRLCSEESEVRIKAAKTLSKLGEPEWQNIIKAEDSDFHRLAKIDDYRLIDGMKLALDN